VKSDPVKKTVLTFGLISGAVSAAFLVATVPFADKIGWDKGEILGYAIIVLSALMVFFGVRSYRENVAGGRLTFGRGFAVRYPDYVNLQHLLRGDLGNRLLRTDARLCREICRPHD
jgi:hypothetical protein